MPINDQEHANISAFCRNVPSLKVVKILKKFLQKLRNVIFRLDVFMTCFPCCVYASMWTNLFFKTKEEKRGYGCVELSWHKKSHDHFTTIETVC